ncbi:aa3-type cytochrome c oxidase subunit IV [Palleronia sediminis]|uniref:Aa3-type cytochrome c oxidase subunit IV n=1 Tax=Palleronia sediminis TaxID=2547833 RepID=A0A4R6AEE4_9RHOB|nr:aa3-type cytochrome c oxidase subunit IV [Palleronia sediminis]TDL81607.1 aa3-type cytochrome c oxidase subunit IV [Palleronia sediminis]
MAKHTPGSMDIEEQEKTFNGFIKWTTRLTIGIIVALILLYIVNG